MNSRTSEVVSGNPRSSVELLYAANLGLVIAALTREFKALPPSQWETADSYGRLGLWHASQRFDPARGFKFSTFACRCIRCYILRGLRRDRDQARLPCVSLDAPVGEEDAVTRLDLMPADPRCQPDALVIQASGFDALLEPLPERLQLVLRAVYEEKRTLQSVADEWKVSRAAVGSLHVRALKQLRQSPSVQEYAHVQEHAEASSS